MQRNNRIKYLFDMNYQTLCNVAYQYVMDRYMAEDIVQETFIRFWENERVELPDKEAGYYLTRAVKNNCISFLRKEIQSVSFQDQGMGLADTLYYEDEGEKIQRDKMDRLEAAIQQLPPKCKQIFLLCKMEQKKYREIAEMLSISVKTVENQMSKAIAFLRSYFGETTILMLLIKTSLLMHV